MTLLKRTAALLLATLTLLSACASTPNPSSPSDTTKEIYKKVKPSVVSIYLFKEDKNMFIGSGFVAQRGADTVVVTGQHVVSENEKYKIKTNDNVFYTITSIDKIGKKDLAFLKTDKPISAPQLKLASANPEVGEDIFVLGHPSPSSEVFYNWIHQGIVNGYMDVTGLTTAEDFTHDYMGISTQLSPGNSGGPVVNNKGEVVGIAVCGFRNVGNIQFAVPVSVIKESL